MKQALIGAGLMAILAIAIILWILRGHSFAIQGLESIINSDRDSIAFHRNKAGEMVASVQQTQVSLQQYKDSHPKDLAQIEQEFGIRAAKIESIVRASFKVHNSGTSAVRHIFEPDTTTIANGDSVERSSFDISDDYLLLHGVTKTDPDKPWLTVDWDYQYSDTISFVAYTKKKWFLGKKTYWVDSKLENPKATVVSLKSVQIKEFVDKRWSVGPGVMIDPFNGRVVVGFGINYALIRF